MAYLFPFLVRTTYYNPAELKQDTLREIHDLMKPVVAFKANPAELAASLTERYPVYYHLISTAVSNSGIGEFISNWAYFNAYRTKHIVLIYIGNKLVIRALRTIIGNITFRMDPSGSPSFCVPLSSYLEIKKKCPEWMADRSLRLSNLSLSAGTLKLNTLELGELAMLASYGHLENKLRDPTRYPANSSSLLAELIGYLMRRASLRRTVRSYARFDR